MRSPDAEDGDDDRPREEAAPRNMPSALIQVAQRHRIVIKQCIFEFEVATIP